MLTSSVANITIFPVCSRCYLFFAWKILFFVSINISEIECNYRLDSKVCFVYTSLCSVKLHDLFSFLSLHIAFECC